MLNFSYILDHFGLEFFPKIDGMFKEFCVHFAGCTINFLVANPPAVLLT